MKRWAILLIAVVSPSLAAQQDSGVGIQRRTSDPAALLIEIGAGALGASTGLIYTYAAATLCDDLVADEKTHSLNMECLGHMVLGLLIVAPIGATLGNRLGREITGVRAPTKAAFVGSALGTVIGFALANRLASESRSPAPLLATLLVSQGAGAALVARVFEKP